MGDSKTSPRYQAPIVERHLQWLEEFKNGATYAEIAKNHGYARSTVHEAIHLQLKKAADRRNGLADVALELQIARYEWLWAKACNAVEKAEAGRELGVAQLLNSGRLILDSMTKLMGLDQPQRAEVTVHTVSDIDREIANLADMLREKARADADAAGLDDVETPILDALAAERPADQP